MLTEPDYSMDELLAGLMAFGNDAVARAGSMLQDRFGTARVADKGRFDLVTDADLAVERDFAERLQRAFPEHRMLGEETHEQSQDCGRGYCWVLDPLDGTVNYAAGLPPFAVSLALLDCGEPLLAWVLDVARGELFHARRGAGATLDGRPLCRHGDRPDSRDVPTELSPSGRVLPIGLSTGFLRHMLGGPDRRLLDEIHRRFGKFRVLGSQALQLCYVAAGRLCATASVESKLWDEAAGALILTESGCRYSTLAGERVFPLQAGSPLWRGRAIGSLAGDPASHRVLVDLIESARKGSKG